MCQWMRADGSTEIWLPFLLFRTQPDDENSWFSPHGFTSSLQIWAWRFSIFPGYTFHGKNSNLVEKSKLDPNQEPRCELNKHCKFQSSNVHMNRTFAITSLPSPSKNAHNIVLKLLHRWLAHGPKSERRRNKSSPLHNRWHHSSHFSFDFDYSGCFVPSIVVHGVSCMRPGCNDMQYLMAADSFLKCDTFPLLPRLDSQALEGCGGL